MPLQPGQQLAHYRIAEKIGEGSMGEVYEAEQSVPVKRRVAIKVIRAGLDSAELLARFSAEQQALALMSHPYIAAVHEAGATREGRPYVVMEYVDGEPVTDHVRRHRLDLGARLDLYLKICEAVSHAHQKGVIHRDLKPSNILVAQSAGLAVPKVIDFGIAKATQQPLTERTLKTTLGQLVGTPEYMSPEQAAGKGLDVDTRADVYALGAILYELLAGSNPLPREALRKAGLEEMLRLIREHEPERPSDRVSALSRRPGKRLPATTAEGSQEVQPADNDEPEVASSRPEGDTLARKLAGDLDWITLRALEKDRERRYASVADLVEDLQRYRRNEPVLAGPPSRSYRLKKFIQRHRAGFASGMLLVVVLLASAFAVSWQWRKAVVASQNARQEAARAERINTFLQDMLGSADPARIGRGVTVREVLDQAAATLERGLSTDPQARADAHHTLGETYSSLGSFEEGRHHLERALALRRDLHGQDHESITLSLIALSQCLLGLDEASEARRLALEGLRMQRRIVSEPNALITESLLILALAELRLVDLEGAERMARAATAQAEALGAGHERILARSLHGLSTVLQERQDQEGCERAARRALAINERVMGRNHPDTLNSLESVAAALMLASQSPENTAAISDLRREVLERAKVIFGEDHPRVADAQNNLAVLLMLKTPHLTEARDLQESALKIWRRVFESGHTNLTAALNNLGFVEHHLGLLEEAAAHYEEALAMEEDSATSSHKLVTLGNLGMVRHHQGKYQEAGEIYQRWLRNMAGLTTAKSEPMVWRSIDRACLMIHMGKLEEAEQSLVETDAVLAGLEEEGIHLPEHRRWIRHLWGVLRARQNNWGEAEALMAEVLPELAERRAGFLMRRHHFKTAAAICRAGGRNELAESYSRALAQMEAQVAATHDAPAQRDPRSR